MTAVRLLVHRKTALLNFNGLHAALRRAIASFSVVCFGHSATGFETATTREWVVWNVGQGLWVTDVRAARCEHFDIGGERAPWTQIKTSCLGHTNLVHYSHWDWDHIGLSQKARGGLPNLCIASAPGGKTTPERQAWLDQIPNCPGARPNFESPREWTDGVFSARAELSTRSSFLSSARNLKRGAGAAFDQVFDETLRSGSFATEDRQNKSRLDFENERRSILQQQASAARRKHPKRLRRENSRSGSEGDEPGSELSNNDQSRVYFDDGFLLPGDSTIRQEHHWGKAGRLAQVRVLVLGHHGSRTSTSDWMLAQMPNLRQAVASARFKKYGHPHARVVADLKAHGVALLRTEEWGSIHFLEPDTPRLANQPYTR